MDREQNGTEYDLGDLNGVTACGGFGGVSYRVGGT